jgi:hypothetical protein
MLAAVRGELGALSSIQCCKGGVLDVCSAPKATELMRCRETTRGAKNGHEQMRQIRADFLGNYFRAPGLTGAKKTIVDLIEKASRLYEHERSAALAATALEMYVRSGGSGGRRLAWLDIVGITSGRWHARLASANGTSYQPVEPPALN